MWRCLSDDEAGTVASGCVGTKAERRAARERVAAYHEAQLAELVGHVAGAVDRYRAGEVDAYAVDDAVFQYSRAARELWKFCWAGSAVEVEFVSHTLDRLAEEGDTIDWWERGRHRRSR